MKRPSGMSIVTGSPRRSWSIFLNGAPYVVRWPAMAVVPGSPGSGVSG
jgi:hypothetical protein